MLLNETQSLFNGDKKAASEHTNAT